MAKKLNKQESLVPSERIERAILLIRGQKVLLDSDLAELYGVGTKTLNQAVKRNLRRFPADFMFRLNRIETQELNRSQIVTGSQKHRDPRYPPYVFTEQGVAMLSSVLHSDRAVDVNIEIMRAFVRLRELLAGHADLSRRLDELEQKYDAQFRAVFDAIRQLMIPPEKPKKGRIGFRIHRDGE
jgi:hypothetical protein